MTIVAVFVILLIVLILVRQVRSRTNALDGIDYDSQFSKKLVEIDEPLELISTITNKLYHIRSFIRLSEQIAGVSEKVDMMTDPHYKRVTIQKFGLDRRLYSSTLYLIPRSKLRRTLKIAFDKRGRYLFRGASLYGGDFVGSKTQYKYFPLMREVVVYPKAIDVPQLQEIMGGFLGDISVRRFIMEDPILTIGTREYTGREPLKQMSWKHTARTNQMMGNHQMVVKQFDYTTEMVVTIFLDISKPKGKKTPDEYLENCFSVARTASQYLEDQKVSFEFVMNAYIAGFETNQIAQSLGKAHLRLIFEKLGRATYEIMETYEEMIERFMIGQDKNRSIIIITPRRDVTKQALAEKLQKRTTGALTFIYGEDFVGGAESDIS